MTGAFLACADCHSQTWCFAENNGRCGQQSFGEVLSGQTVSESSVEHHDAEPRRVRVYPSGLETPHCAKTGVAGGCASTDCREQRCELLR